MSKAFNQGWNAAIMAAAAACDDVDVAATGQGTVLGRARPSTRNPHSHRSAEVQLGAQRCRTDILKLFRSKP